MLLLPRDSSYSERDLNALRKLVRWAEEKAVREGPTEDEEVHGCSNDQEPPPEAGHPGAGEK